VCGTFQLYVHRRKLSEEEAVAHSLEDVEILFDVTAGEKEEDEQDQEGDVDDHVHVEVRAVDAVP
jgi:Asp-tRNA(Asn)/Glu-tRNA(Gln) amidotransferase A subunit family amidase